MISLDYSRDTAGSTELERELRHTTQPLDGEIVIDRGVKFLASSGLLVLLKMPQRRRRDEEMLAVMKPNKTVVRS